MERFCRILSPERPNLYSYSLNNNTALTKSLFEEFHYFETLYTLYRLSKCIIDGIGLLVQERERFTSTISGMKLKICADQYEQRK